MIERTAVLAAKWFAESIDCHSKGLDPAEFKIFEEKLAEAISRAIENGNKLVLASSERFGSVALIRGVARETSRAISAAVLELPLALACPWVSKEKLGVSSWLHNPETIYPEKDQDSAFGVSR